MLATQNYQTYRGVGLFGSLCPLVMCTVKKEDDLELELGIVNFRVASFYGLFSFERT